MRIPFRSPPPAPPEPWDDASDETSEQPRRRGVARRIGGAVVKLVLAYYAVCVVLLVVYRFAPPPATGVQLQRRAEAWRGNRVYRAQKRFVRLNDLPEHVSRAVVAAEDGRFWTHHGFDLVEMRNAQRDIVDGGRMRGASTITQQLVKNLFGCACRNPLLGGARKINDYALTPFAELILGKRRILELYLNTAEWGDGVFGIEAAAQRVYHCRARALTRSQAAALAALLPNPHTRTVRNTAAYRREILRRMAHRGW